REVCVRLQRQAESRLLPSAVIEPAPPVRQIDHPPPLRRGVHLGAVLVPLVRACRHDDTRIDFKRRVKMLELGNDIPLQVLPRLRTNVERRDEEAPVLEAIGEIGDVLWFELEEKLPDPPPLRSRLKSNPRVCGPDSCARHEAKSGLERVTDLFPIEEQVPPIVGIRETKPSGVIATSRLVIRALHEQIDP